MADGSQGVRRVTVDPDGTRHRELVGPDDPVLGSVAAIVERELIDHLANRSLGISDVQVDRRQLESSGFSIAEEIDFYFTIAERSDARPEGERGPGPRDDGLDRLRETVRGQLVHDLGVELWGP